MTPRQRSTKQSRSPGVVFVVVAALLIAVLFQRGLLDRWLPSALAAHSAPGLPAQHTGPIEVFFTTPSLIYPDVRGKRGASPLLQAVIADVDAAKHSIDVASFDFDLAPLTDALLRARTRGVAVRLIVDSLNLEDPAVAQQTGRLQSAAVPVHFQRTEPFMHNKFIVIDHAITWTGSWNMTENDTYRNNNNFQRIASAKLSSDFADEFAQMFKGLFGTSKASLPTIQHIQVGRATINVYFSPQDGTAAYVVQRLNVAHTSIRVLAFSFTSDAITQVLLQKHAAGVQIQGVFEAQNASGTGADVAQLQHGNISALEDGNCYIMHHKVFIIDDQTVITGSYNFTSSAERYNDENLLIIDDSALARQYITEFERVQQQAQQPGRCN